MKLHENCMKCGICVMVCPTGAVRHNNNNKCKRCCKCISICPGKCLYVDV